ncbi:hypothetical protein WDU94_007798 [Cyamophila willieti]
MMDIRNYMEKSVVDESDEGETEPPVAKKTKTEQQNSEGSGNETNDILSTTPRKVITEFLEHLLEHMNPKLDKLSHKRGAEKFNWNEINFKDFTPEQCCNLWQAIQAHQRKFRTMKELVSDAITWNKVPRKIPGQPKKPLSAYILFFQKEYKKMKENDPSITCIQASKIVSERFKTLSPKKKLKLQDEVKDSNETYKCKMALFKEEHPDLVGDLPAASKSKSSTTTSSSSSRSPLKIFCDELLATSSDDVKHTREEWNSLDDYQKVCYIHKSKVEYLEKLQENADLKPSVSKDEDKLYFSVLNVPVKPAGSAYALFTQEYLNREEIKNIKSNERMTIMNKQWKELSADTKKEFNDLVKEKSAEYTAKYAAFLQRLSPDETNNFLKYNTLPDSLVYNVGEFVKTEIIEDDGAAANNDDFPKSAREFYRQKAKGDVKWKNLSEDEKEKWRKKFEKKKQKHYNNVSVVSLGGNETE